MPRYSVPYIYVRYVGSNTAQAGLHNMFDTTNYGGTTAVISQNALDYDATNGEFTMLEKGTYVVQYVAYLLQSGTGTLTNLRIRQNGSVVFSAQPIVHTSVNPVAVTAAAILECEGDDVITGDTDSNGTFTLQTMLGTSMNIWKIA